MMRVIVVDGYGSFIHNPCQQIGIFGAEPVVVQGDTPPGRPLLSPGPGYPGDVVLYQAVPGTNGIRSPPESILAPGGNRLMPGLLSGMGGQA
ncbi:MAG: hypothetical protein GX885_02320 [Methanomicrobiales archaeon]|nr:hypothetical protein [Methanomicrobiales archaeon]